MKNDRFRFRVWDKENKQYFEEMDYDAILKADGSLYFLCFDYGHLLEFTETEMAKKGNFIVEHCTGLKDKNGCLIYEGDIVRFFWYPDYTVYPVEWNNEPGRFLYCGYNQEINDRFHSGMGEVIGNIHEMDLKKAQQIGVKHKNEPDWNPAWMNEKGKDY